MKIALITVFLIIAGSFAALFFMGIKSQNGQAPGVVEGGLAKCPNKPNCVVSEHAEDADHYVDPVPIAGDDEVPAMEMAVMTITEMEGVVLQNSDNYVAATFESSVFGFVDDFELRMDPDSGVIHIRSASRVGYGDGGVNLDRVKLFKQLFSENMREGQQVQ